MGSTILAKYSALQDTQLKYFSVSNFKDICESMDIRNIIDSIKGTHFYNQLQLLLFIFYCN